MLAISVPMFAAFIFTLLLAQYLLRLLISKFPDSPAMQGLAALIL